MIHLMHKLNYVTQRSSVRHGLAMGIAKGLCKQVGGLDHMVIPKLNETYMFMHNLSTLQVNQTGSPGHKLGNTISEEVKMKVG